MSKEMIVFLPKEKYKGTPVPLDYRNDSYYDLEIDPLDEKGCTISLVRKPRGKRIARTTMQRISRMIAPLLFFIVTHSF